VGVTWQIHHHDVAATPWPIEDESIQCVVTSPPYWGLRDYGIAGQLGLERTPEEYVEKMVSVFREVRRVLRRDGTVWLNLGDCYATGAGRAFSPGGGKQGDTYRKMGAQVPDSKNPKSGIPVYQPNRMPIDGLKPKDLVGIPWRVAFALQADGWWLRSDIVWSKPNAMPESITDRPTRAHECVFLLTKSRHYFYDADAIRTPAAESSIARINQPGFDQQTGGQKDYRNHGQSVNGENKSSNVSNRSMRRTLEHFADKQRGHGRRHEGFNGRWDALSKEQQQAGGANARTVWSIATEPYPEAHFATFPTELASRCILAGSREGDTVLDPFMGSGTVALVADMHGRHSIGLELNPEYIALAEKRIRAPRSEAEAERRGLEDAWQMALGIEPDTLKVEMPK